MTVLFENYCTNGYYISGQSGTHHMILLYHTYSVFFVRTFSFWRNGGRDWIYHAEYCTHNYDQQPHKHHGGHNGKTAVVRLLLCTAVYCVVAWHVPCWLLIKPRGVLGILKAKAIAPPFEIVFVRI